MDEEMSQNSSDLSGSSTDDSLPSISMEKCLLNNSVVNLPDEMCEQEEYFNSILSMDTWQNYLSDEQRSRLAKFLPSFNDSKELENTVEQLFSGKNFKFGNPCQNFFSKLRDGYYNLDVAKIAKKLQKAQFQEYRHDQRRYYYRLLQDVLVSRKKLLEAATDLPPGVPVKMEQLQSSDKAYAIARVEDRTKRRYFRELQDVREECDALDTSSDDENYPEGPPPKLTKKQKKQLHSMEQSMSPDVHRISSTMSTLPLTALNDNSNNHQVLLRSPSIIEITDEQYREMLFKHKKRRFDKSTRLPLDVSEVTLDGVLDRTSCAKRGILRLGSNELMDKRIKLKVKKKKRTEDLPPPIITDPLGLESNMTVIKAEPGDPQNEVNIMSDGEPPIISRPGTPPIEDNGVKRFNNFFCMLREVILDLTDKRATTLQLQECIREWEESPTAKDCIWYRDCTPKKWSELVNSALKFLSGESLGVQPKDFIPYIDYKEKLMQWVWVDHDDESERDLKKLYTFWLLKKDDIVLETSDTFQGDPPPPRVSTTWVVQPTTPDEKSTYHIQELVRYQNPHKSFTFKLHSYESVVGPVKGVYGKEMATSVASKAREHSLLVPTRPFCVTLLSLVRDAVARLPNGEGTRTDISQLLKDSQFIAEATDQQLQTVVSGALDRLHYEKDPCVKYDPTKKLWIYLHRNRDELAFEKIHEAQAQAAKAKKAIPKSKLNRAKNKESSKSHASNSHHSNHHKTASANVNANASVSASVSVSEDQESSIDKHNEQNQSINQKITNANLLAQKILKQEFHQSNNAKKTETENAVKSIQKKNTTKTVVTTISEPRATSTPVRLVGQPQLVQSPQMPNISFATCRSGPVITSASSISHFSKGHIRVASGQRMTSPQLLTMQPAIAGQTRVRCSLTQGQRLPHSAVIQTVLSQAARAQLTQALNARGKPVLLQSSTTSTASSPTISVANRPLLTHKLDTHGQSVIIRTSSHNPMVSQSVSQVSRAQVNPSVIGPGQQVIIQSSAGRAQTAVSQSSNAKLQPLPQVTTMLTNLAQSRKSGQSTHHVLSPVNVGHHQRPTLLATMKPGTNIVQRSISMADGSCVTPQAIQLLASQSGIPLAGQRITTSQVNIPVNFNKHTNTCTLGQKSVVVDNNIERQDEMSSISQIVASASQAAQLQIKTCQSQNISLESPDRHRALTSPLTLNSSQNNPSRPSSTGSSQSLPSPKALVANVNAAQLVGDINTNLGDCSSPITIPQITTKSEPFKSINKTQISQPAYVHQLFTKGHMTLPITDKSSGVKTSMSNITHTVLLKPETSMMTTAMTHTSSSKPLVAHIISSPQVMSMGNIITQGHKQAIRIHSGNVVRPGHVIGQQVGVLQPCSGTGVSRLALVSPANAGSTNQTGTTTKLVAVGPGGHLGVVDASQLASLTRGLPSQIHMPSNKPVVFNTQTGLKIMSGLRTVTNAEQTVFTKKSSHPVTNVLVSSHLSTTSPRPTVTLAKAGSQTYVMAAVAGSSGVMHPVSVPTVSGLQSVKVIPMSQTGAKGQMTQQMLARIITPSMPMHSQAGQVTSQIQTVQAKKLTEYIATTKPPPLPHPDPPSKS